MWLPPPRPGGFPPVPRGWPPRRCGRAPPTVLPATLCAGPGAPSVRVMPYSRHGVPAYLLIAFGLAWAPFLPLLWGGPEVPPVLMPFAPAIACVVVRRWVTREGFGDAGLRLNLRYWRLYLIALAGRVVVDILTH